MVVKGTAGALRRAGIVSILRRLLEDPPCVRVIAIATRDTLIVFYRQGNLVQPGPGTTFVTLPTSRSLSSGKGILGAVLIRSRQAR